MCYVRYISATGKICIRRSILESSFCNLVIFSLYNYIPKWLYKLSRNISLEDLIQSLDISSGEKNYILDS